MFVRPDTFDVVVHARGGSLLWLVLVATCGGLGFGIAHVATLDHRAAIDVLRATPRANLSVPRSGPAIYSGVVVGPADRIDPAGKHAAAYWWWVAEHDGEDGWKTKCFHREIRGMRLRDNMGHEAPLGAFETELSLSLLADNRDDFGDPLFIDLGENEAFVAPTIPALAVGCAAEDRRFDSRSLADSAPVEVLACHRDGVLHACPGNPSAVIAVGGIARHRERHADRIGVAFLIASAFLWALSIGAVVWFALLSDGVFAVRRVRRP